MDKKETLNLDWLEKYAHKVIEHMNEDHQNTICLLYTSDAADE